MFYADRVCEDICYLGWSFECKLNVNTIIEKCKIIISIIIYRYPLVGLLMGEARDIVLNVKTEV